jgi:hypothetical protein
VSRILASLQSGIYSRQVAKNAKWQARPVIPSVMRGI